MAQVSIPSSMRAITIPFMLSGTDLTTIERYTLGAIIFHGEVSFPGSKRLAWIVGCSIPAIRKATRVLMEKGWVLKTARHEEGGRRTTNAYRLQDPRDVNTASSGVPIPGISTPLSQVSVPPLSQVSDCNSDLILNPNQDQKVITRVRENAPPVSGFFQHLALRIIADHDSLYPAAKLLPVAKRAIFARARSTCKELLPEWGEAHILGMWEEYKYAQQQAKRPVNPMWFFTAKTIQETHHEQIKFEENQRGKR